VVVVGEGIALVRQRVTLEACRDQLEEIAALDARRVLRAADPVTIVAGLFLTGAVTTLLATALFRGSERRARDRGLLDRTTGS
jgi:hypothetical protein